MHELSMAFRIDGTLLALIAFLVPLAHTASTGFNPTARLHEFPAVVFKDDSSPVRRASLNKSVKQPLIVAPLSDQTEEQSLDEAEQEPSAKMISYPLQSMSSPRFPNAGNQTVNIPRGNVVDVIGNGSSQHHLRKAVRTPMHIPVRAQKMRGHQHFDLKASDNGSDVEEDPQDDEVPGQTEDYAGGADDEKMAPSVDTNSGSQILSANGSLKVSSADTWTVAPQPDYIRMVDGVGALAYDTSPTDSRSMNFELRHRLIVQDYVTLGCILVIFVWTLHLSCGYVYKMSDDASPALFYSDPSPLQPRVICDSADLGAFMRVFNSTPAKVDLRIIGRRRQEEGISSLILQGQWGNAWRRILDIGHRTLDGLDVEGTEYTDVLFDVLLDLTPFIDGDGRLSSEEDHVELQKFLINTSNPLETVFLVKHVEWSCWEDVATNIRQRLRRLGFNGEVEVIFQSKESTLIFRNHPLANFVRNHVTQALIIFSVVGAFILGPFIWFRKRKRIVHSFFKVEVDIQRYWELISDSLHPVDGFSSSSDATSTLSPAGTSR